MVSCPETYIGAHRSSAVTLEKTGRGRGKRHENAVKKSPKKLGEEEGDLGRDGGGIEISSACPSLSLSFPLESHPRFEDDGPFFTLVKSLEPDRGRGEGVKSHRVGRNFLN